jgi:PKHD-type hydroxylase
VLLAIPDVLDRPTVDRFRAALADADWGDGAVTAGHQSARVKHNLQIDERDPLARELGETILGILGRHPLFISAALPQRIYPPMFVRYRAGIDRFGDHVDNAIRYWRHGTLRTDLSATLFLSDPDSHDGGELTIQDTFGPRTIRLPAGHMVLYPSSSLHGVAPVTRGERLAAVFWLQSLVRDDGQRSLLFDLDQEIQQLGRDFGDQAAINPRILGLTNVYHNLVRRWAIP